MKYMPGYIGATQNFLHNSGAKIFGKRIHFYNKLTIIKKKGIFMFLPHLHSILLNVYIDVDMTILL
jgi:hypothetical protein